MNEFFAGKSHVLDAVNMIHDFITTANSSPYTARLTFESVLKIMKLTKFDVKR